VQRGPHLESSSLSFSHDCLTRHLLSQPSSPQIARLSHFFVFQTCCFFFCTVGLMFLIPSPLSLCHCAPARDRFLPVDLFAVAMAFMTRRFQVCDFRRIPLRCEVVEQPPSRDRVPCGPLFLVPAWVCFWVLLLLDGEGLPPCPPPLR